MSAVILTNRATGKTSTGVLESATGVQIPDSVWKIFPPGDGIVGLIKSGKKILIARYNKETPANELQATERQLHEALMAHNKIKPGDVIGFAVDVTDGTLYHFQSKK